ncbi:DUF1488 family protein [Rhizobium sp. CAU 1783]
MSLYFANRTRTYDDRRGVIRFVGYDGLKQIVFLLSVGLFEQDSSTARPREQGYLLAFDRSYSRILEIARALYQKNNRPMIKMDANAVGSSLRSAN